MEASTSTTSGHRKRKKTTINALSDDALCMIFAFLNLTELVRCSAVCKSWSIIVDKLKLLQIQYHKEQKEDPKRPSEACSTAESLNMLLKQIAMEQHKLSLKEGSINIFQWKGHSVRAHQCRMKMGLVLTGVGDKVMRLWSAESYKCLDEYSLPDRTPLVDFDFDEGKVVGLVGTRICIWRRTGTRDIFSSCDGLFTKGLCMRYVDPQAVVGCEDGRARVFDMYSRKCSQIVKMHAGSVTCLSFIDDQLIVSGSSLGSVSVTDLSSGQQVATMRSNNSTGIKTLCVNPCSQLLFVGSTAGHVSCWDLRTLKSLWETRVSPNVIYSLHHLRNDTSTLVTGGIDGVLGIVDQDSGEVLSRCVMDESRPVPYRSADKYGVVERKKATRLPEDARIDLMPKASRPPITCLAVGMQKIITTHNDKYIRVWRFNTRNKSIRSL